MLSESKSGSPAVGGIISDISILANRFISNCTNNTTNSHTYESVPWSVGLHRYDLSFFVSTGKQVRMYMYFLLLLSLIDNGLLI